MLLTFYNKYKNQIAILLGMFTVVFFILLFNDIVDIRKTKNILAEGIEVVDLGLPEIKTSYVPSAEYFKTFDTSLMPVNAEQFSTVDEFATFEDTSSTFMEEWSVKNANKALFDLADKYYQVYWGDKRVSPLYPLALANVETCNRADHSVTWSSLYPSKILPVSLLYDADVTTVLGSGDKVYKALTTEWSTRDRGALQMSPTYGTGSDYFNKMMSGTERSKLKEAGYNLSDTWIKGSSTESGDRFHTPDVCLRLSAANTSAIESMISNKYVPESDLHLVVMLAMYHHRSGVWSNANHNKKCGEWLSSGLAFEYSKELTSVEFAEYLKDYISDNPDVYTLSQEEALKLYKDYFGKNPTKYTKSTLVSSYPIKVLHSYIKMNMLYATLE